MSRFEWGFGKLICKPPDVETRLAILRKKSRCWGWTFPTTSSISWRIASERISVGWKEPWSGLPPTSR